MKKQDQAARAQSRKIPSGWGRLWAAFGLGVAAYAIAAILQVFAVTFVEAGKIDMNTALAVTELAAGVCGLLFLVAIGGKRISRPSLKGMGVAWKAAAWMFVVDGGLIAIDLLQVAMGIEPFELAEGWPARTGVLVLLCIGVGLFEETTMRGLCLNGLLARMGRTRAGVYGAVILSSLIFGLLHFDVLIDFTDPMQVAQNIMKVVQTGMCGFIFAAILVKTRNIWTVIVIHAANDFMLLFMTSALKAEEVSTQYVMTGDEGVAVLVVYCVICVLYTPLIVVGKRLIDEVGPWRGDFYPYEKARQAAMLQDATPAEPIPAAAPVAPVAEIALAEAAHPVLAAEIPQIGATIPRHAAPGALQNLEPGAPTDETDAEALAKAMRGKHAAPRHARQEGTTDGQSL